MFLCFFLLIQSVSFAYTFTYGAMSFLCIEILPSAYFLIMID